MRVIMGIGNEMNGDDAIGILVARKLKEVLKDWEVIEAGIMPENYTSKLKKLSPSLLVMIDAMDKKRLLPGDIKVISREEIGELTLSTHSLPLSLLYDYLSEFIPKIVLIGIQIRKHIPYTRCMLPIDEITKKVLKILNNL